MLDGHRLLMIIVIKYWESVVLKRIRICIWWLDQAFKLKKKKMVGSFCMHSMSVRKGKRERVCVHVCVCVCVCVYVCLSLCVVPLIFCSRLQSIHLSVSAWHWLKLHQLSIVTGMAFPTKMDIYKTNSSLPFSSNSWDWVPVFWDIFKELSGHKVGNTKPCLS